MKKYLPSADLFIGQPIPKHEHYTIQKRIGSGCNAHVFLASSTTLKRDIACKIIPVANLIGVDEQPPRWQEEIQKANSLGSQRVVKFYNMGPWTVENHDCVFLLSDYVQGESLDQYLKRVKRIDVGFVRHFLEEMLDFLRELDDAQLQHGDFHEGNILVEDRSASLVGPRRAFRITDFGVAPVTTGSQLLDDFDQLANTLRRLLRLVDYQACSAEDRYIFDALNDDLLAKALTEKDPTLDARARNPRELFEWLTSLHRKFLSLTAGTTRRTLSTPFDYLSCEQIGESHVLLKELYSDKMLGLPHIEDINNLVLTGPRGCGKTTVFRSLCLKHRFLTEDDTPDAIQYFGIYYRCDDLYFNFPRYEQPERTEAVDVPMHFVSVTLVRELLESLGLWLQRHFPARWSTNEAAAATTIRQALNLSPSGKPGPDSFEDLRRTLGKERERAARKQRFVADRNQTFGDYLGPDAVPKVCEVLFQHFVELQHRPIFFFVDDYSTPKITSALQRNLNRLLMQRSSACFFKLATESPASYASSDIDGKAYVEGREFRLINLGIDFISAERDDKLRFVDDVFGRRFKYAAGYPVQTLDELIGDAPQDLSHNEVARNIRDKKTPQIWGRRALGELCSGDVHFLIELVGKMVAAAGGKDALTAADSPAVHRDIQNKTIRAEAGNFLRNLRALPNGQALVEVVEAFGAVASSYLRFRDSKNEESAPPHQASRIEPYEDPHLDNSAKQIYDDLLRYSVFIEDVRGKSRRGNVVPRLYLRRFLIPFFNLTFSKRDSLERSVDEFRELLTAPATFASRKRLKSREVEGPAAPEQLPLLDPSPRK